MMEIEKGPTPELAVMIVLPSGLNARPKGCGATVICRPYGDKILPFGIIEEPSRLIPVYWLPAGEEAVHAVFCLVSFEVLQEMNETKKNEINSNRFTIACC